MVMTQESRHLICILIFSYYSFTLKPSVDFTGSEDIAETRAIDDIGADFA